MLTVYVDDVAWGSISRAFGHELDYEIVHAMPLHLCLSIKKLARLSLMGLNENGRGVDSDFDRIASLCNAQTIPYPVVGGVCFNTQSYHRSSCVGSLRLEYFNISMKMVRILKRVNKTPALFNSLYGLFVRL